MACDDHAEPTLGCDDCKEGERQQPVLPVLSNEHESVATRAGLPPYQYALLFAPPSRFASDREVALWNAARALLEEATRTEARWTERVKRLEARIDAAVYTLRGRVE